MNTSTSSPSLSPSNSKAAANDTAQSPCSIVTELLQTDTAMGLVSTLPPLGLRTTGAHSILLNPLGCISGEPLVVGLALSGRAGKKAHELAKRTTSKAVHCNDPRPGWYDVFQDLQDSLEALKEARQELLQAEKKCS
jgi:hypothetical protein